MKARALLAAIGFVCVTGCSRETPVAPEHSPASVSPTTDALTGVEGIYEILFLKEVLFQPLQPVLNDTLNVGESLVLNARVTDGSGVPAQEGTVTYEYCERQNVLVPSAECVSGRGRWRRHMSISVVLPLAFFGSCSTPRTIGFRFKFNGVNGPIASDVSAPKDVSWQ